MRKHQGHVQRNRSGALASWEYRRLACSYAHPQLLKRSCSLQGGQIARIAALRTRPESPAAAAYRYASWAALEPAELADGGPMRLNAQQHAAPPPSAPHGPVPACRRWHSHAELQGQLRLGLSAHLLSPPQPLRSHQRGSRSPLRSRARQVDARRR